MMFMPDFVANLKVSFKCEFGKQFLTFQDSYIQVDRT